MFKRLELERFTVFEQANFDWASGINVLVGANGTGKTHLLKLLYCLRSNLHGEGYLIRSLEQVFLAGGISPLFRDSSSGETLIKVIIEKSKITLESTVTFDPTTSNPIITPKYATGDVSPIYLPAKEILSIAPGLLSLYNKYHLAIEESHIRTLESAYLPPLRNLDDQYKSILTVLESLIGGEVTFQGEVFFVDNRIIHLVAEGHRKLALLWQLIRNGSITPNIPLLWDEPEANLNPSLMQEVVKVLLMLAKSGVQVFIATHNYAFLRELDFQKGDVPTRFFALENTLDHGVIPHAAESYRDIKPNKIAEEYLRLYDLEIKRSLGDV